jgi:hypothetical protein
MWKRDASVTEKPVVGTVAEYLQSLDAAVGMAKIDAAKAEFLNAAVAFLNQTIADYASQGVEPPAGLVGHTVTKDDVLNRYGPLRDFCEENEVAVQPQAEIIEIDKDGVRLGTVSEWHFACEMDLYTWTVVWDNSAKRLTAKANTYDWPRSLELLV